MDKRYKNISASEQLDLRPEQLVLHGFSLGSVMAGHVAAHRQVAGLVLEGSGSTVTEWVSRGVPWYGKPFVRVKIEPGLENRGNLQNVQVSRAPLLLLAGKKDRQAPWKMSRTLFKASVTPESSKRLVVVPEAGHGNALDGGEHRWFDLGDFLRQVFERAVADLLAEHAAVGIDAEQHAAAAVVEHGGQRMHRGALLAGAALELQRF